MDTTKPVLSSKTVLMNLGLALLNALVFFGVLKSDLGVNAIVAAGGATALINTVGNLAAAWFRKIATSKLV